MGIATRNNVASLLPPPPPVAARVTSLASSVVAAAASGSIGIDAATAGVWSQVATGAGLVSPPSSSGVERSTAGGGGGSAGSCRPRRCRPAAVGQVGLGGGGGGTAAARHGSVRDAAAIDDGDTVKQAAAASSPALGGWPGRTGSPAAAGGLIPLTFSRRGGAAPPGTIRYVADVIATVFLGQFSSDSLAARQGARPNALTNRPNDCSNTSTWTAQARKTSAWFPTARNARIARNASEMLAYTQGESDVISMPAGFAAVLWVKL